MLQKSHESPGRIRCRVSWTLRSSSKCLLPIRMNSASPRSGGSLVDPRWMWLLCWLCWFRRDKPHGFVWIGLGDAPIKFGLFMVVSCCLKEDKAILGYPWHTHVYTSTNHDPWYKSPWSRRTWQTHQGCADSSGWMPKWRCLWWSKCGQSQPIQEVVDRKKPRAGRRSRKDSRSRKGPQDGAIGACVAICRGSLSRPSDLPEVAHFCKEIIVALWAWLNGSDFNCLDVAG